MHQGDWLVKTVMKLDVRINGAYVYMGLLYGDGDFWKSMNIAMRCGLDSDCNPSTVGGILGTALGRIQRHVARLTGRRLCRGLSAGPFLEKIADQFYAHIVESV